MYLCANCKKSFTNIDIYNDHMESHRDYVGMRHHFVLPEALKKFHRVVDIHKSLTEKALKNVNVPSIKPMVHQIKRNFTMPTISKSVINRFCKLCNHITPSRIEHGKNPVILKCKRCKIQTIHLLSKSKNVYFKKQIKLKK